MRPSAVEAMLPFLTERFANPSGSHRFARDARRAVDEARDRRRRRDRLPPGRGRVHRAAARRPTTRRSPAPPTGAGVAPCARRPSTTPCCTPSSALGGTVVPVDDAGRVRLDALDAALGADVSIVSVMAVNNEVGTITDLAPIADLVRNRAPDALLHTDAVQAACWLDLRAVWPHVDLLSLSAHKFGGPKGVGVLAVREGAAIDALIVGGGQERERRSGTHNVAGIVALADALAATDAERDDEVGRIAAMRDRLVAGLVAGALRPRDGGPGRQGGRLGARPARRHRERVAAVPARRGRRVRIGGVGVRQRGDGPVARAGGDGHRSSLGRRGATPDAGAHDDRRRRRRRHRRDHRGGDHAARRGRRPGREGHGGDERRGRLVRRRRHARARRPSRRRRDDAPLGRRERHRLLQRRRRRRRPAGRPAARTSTTSSSTSPRTSRPLSSARTSTITRSAGRPTRASSATGR